MDITPLGHAAFKLSGKNAVVVTDPYAAGIGLKFPKHVVADIVTVSHAHPDHNFVEAVEPGKNGRVIFAGPGEYERGGVEITGIETFHDSMNGTQRGRNTLYKIDIDGISIVHCGDLGHKLTEEQVEMIDSVDVLLVPVGGFYTIDAPTAAAVVTQLEPSIVIPMHYNRDGLDSKMFASLTPVSVFLKEMGKEGIVAQPKLKVTKDSLPPEMQVVVLE